MKFKEVRKFLESWGLYPSAEEIDEDLNPEVINQGINACCYRKLCEEATRLYGEPFRSFCSRLIDATDDAFYIGEETWVDVEEAWNASVESFRIAEGEAIKKPKKKR